MWILVLTLFVNGVLVDQYYHKDNFRFQDKEACEMIAVEEQAIFEQYMKDNPPPEDMGTVTGKVTCEPTPKDASAPDPRGHS